MLSHFPFVVCWFWLVVTSHWAWVFSMCEVQRVNTGHNTHQWTIHWMHVMASGRQIFDCRNTPPSRYSKKFRIKELSKIQNPKTLNPKTLNPRFLKIFRFEEIVEAGYFKNFSFQESWILGISKDFKKLLGFLKELTRTRWIFLGSYWTFKNKVENHKLYIIIGYFNFFDNFSYILKWVFDCW
jgi:hypothetical protein